jgi:hypothetical protein
VISFIYQLPLPKDSSRWINALFGQCQAGGNFTAQSGAPFTVNISSDKANIGAGPAQRPGSRNGRHSPFGLFASPLFNHANLSRQEVVHAVDSAEQDYEGLHVRRQLSRFAAACRENFF